MKIIDILNNIANEEEVPKEIKCNNKIYNYCGLCKIYERSEGTVKKTLYDDIYDLNVEVEIIEKNKDIEPLSIKDNCLKDERGCYCSLNKHTRIIANKINELVREVNKLKNNK